MRIAFWYLQIYAMLKQLHINRDSECSGLLWYNHLNTHSQSSSCILLWDLSEITRALHGEKKKWKCPLSIFKKTTVVPCPCRHPAFAILWKVNPDFNSKSSKEGSHILSVKKIIAWNITIFIQLNRFLNLAPCERHPSHLGRISEPCRGRLIMSCEYVGFQETYSSKELPVYPIIKQCQTYVC